MTPRESPPRLRPRREGTEEFSSGGPERPEDVLERLPTGVPVVSAPVGDGRAGFVDQDGELGLGDLAVGEPRRDPPAERDVSHVHGSSVNCESTKGQEETALAVAELATSLLIGPYAGDVDRRRNRSDLLTINDDWRKLVIAAMERENIGRAELHRAIGVSKSFVTKLLRLKSSKAVKVNQIGEDIALAIHRVLHVPVPIRVSIEAEEGHDILEEFVQHDREALEIALGNLRMLQAARRGRGEKSVLTPPGNNSPNDAKVVAVPEDDGGAKKPGQRTRQRR